MDILIGQCGFDELSKLYFVVIVVKYPEVESKKCQYVYGLKIMQKKNI